MTFSSAYEEVTLTTITDLTWGWEGWGRWRWWGLSSVGDLNLLQSS